MSKIIHQERIEILGNGKGIIVTITGKPSSTCYGCSMVLGGSAIRCTAHNVRRVEREIEEEPPWTETFWDGVEW